MRLRLIYKEAQPMLSDQSERPDLSDVDLLDRPHFIEMLPGKSILDGGDFDVWFEECAPLLERVAHGLGFTAADVYGWALSNTIVPVVARDSSGKLTMGGWVRHLSVGDAIRMKAAVAFVAPVDDWPSLASLESLLEKTCTFAGTELAIIWADGGLPALDGWLTMDFAEIPPLCGPALVRFMPRSMARAA
jgi:hypothetical protein